MLKIFSSLVLFFTFSFSDVQLIKKENKEPGNTLLVIAGIHGDEPGGYFAASILATSYKISSGNLWIVPNLNKKSIQRDNRGIHGDMNRKFSAIPKDDKDAQIIKDIKEIILSKKVSLVLNLHDGHGFYRKENQSKIFNPNSWGQTCVIDQCKLSQDQPFGNLNDIALSMKNSMNKRLLESHHSFDVKNTKTKFEDEAMQLSLTYFAVTNNKPAFAIETSKHLSSLAQKVFYQLLAIEEFMKIMDIEYNRDFNLDVKSLEKKLNDYGKLTINGNISFNLNGIKKYLSYIPLKSDDNVFKFTHPLGSFRKVKDRYIILVGNQKITTLRPQYFEPGVNCPELYEFLVDGKLKRLNKTLEIHVKDDLKVLRNNSMRVNVIGYKSKNLETEAGIDIAYKYLDRRFSVDDSEKIFRIEHYKNNKFCSMNMVHFE